MISALWTFAVGLLIAYLFTNHLIQDQQTIQEFSRSSDPTISVYVVKDMLGAMTAHLWIGIILGTFCGIVGGLTVKLAKAINPKSVGKQ